MGLFGKLFGSNKYDANEHQGHLKTKNYKRLDWKIDENEYKKQDYIASSEYIIPSDQMIREVFDKTDSGRTYVVRDVLFRVDYMGYSNDWYKKRDYLFEEITLKKKEKTEQDDRNVYVLEGKGTFLKENMTGMNLESETKEITVYSEVTYKNNTLEVHNGRGFDDTDNWYAFMLLFKLLEYEKYPTESCKTVNIGTCQT
ncbi:MAG: hypothetical protein LBU81_04765 [Methanosarcinales archaeon]|jgi:hypothetical protein|nr:hypothetical protein [Methanosarcinales archaeon]